MQILYSISKCGEHLESGNGPVWLCVSVASLASYEARTYTFNL